MKMAGTAAAGCLIVLAALAGCGKKQQCEVTYVRRAAPTPVAVKRADCGPTVAVMPFRCDAAPDAGDRVSEVLAEKLRVIGGCTVVAPGAVAAGTRGAPELSPQECGRRLGVPYVVAGEVIDYAAADEEGGRPSVGVAARMIETSTGRVVWTGTRASDGSAAWQPGDDVGVLTTRVCADLAVGMGEAWPEIGAGQPIAQKGRAASVQVPSAETDGELVRFPAADIELSARAELIDFPEEADSPGQFGLEDGVTERRAAAEKAPAAPVNGEPADDMSHLPVVPEVYPAEYYVLSPEEAARVLEMFEDPYAPEQAKAGPEAPRPVAEPLDVAVEPVPPEPASTEVLPEPITVAAANPAPAPVGESADFFMPPAPSEELVPVSIGVELDEEAFPLTGPTVVPPPPVHMEYGLDEDRDFAPKAGANDETSEGLSLTLPDSGGDDDLDFFGKMSASLGLELVDTP